MINWKPADDPPETFEYLEFQRSKRCLVFVPEQDLGNKIQFGHYFADHPGPDGKPGWWQIQNHRGCTVSHWAPLDEPEFEKEDDGKRQPTK